ncbi:MAG: hypothetical protein JRD93_19300 [Deltaproteobacteria bacterium]|nr:hypothetical protein [Deltaproteobacteria bacterium]
MQSSPLNEIIKADVEEVNQTILKDTVEPWIFFRSHGINIKKVDGSSISISGVEYSGSSVTVFWEGFVDAYIKKRSLELIEATRLKAVERNIPVKNALQDCLVHLHSMVVKIFNRMAVIDQRLKGKGFPNSVQKVDVQRRIDRNYEVIRILVNAEIDCAQQDCLKKITWLNALELKPNFFGLGINLNWLIPKAFRRKN